MAPCSEKIISPSCLDESEFHNVGGQTRMWRWCWGNTLCIRGNAGIQLEIPSSVNFWVKDGLDLQQKYPRHSDTVAWRGGGEFTNHHIKGTCNIFRSFHHWNSSHKFMTDSVVQARRELMMKGNLKKRWVRCQSTRLKVELHATGHFPGLRIAEASLPRWLAVNKLSLSPIEWAAADKQP